MNKDKTTSMTVSELIEILSNKPSGHIVQINNADVHSVMCFNRVQVKACQVSYAPRNMNWPKPPTDITDTELGIDDVERS